MLKEDIEIISEIFSISVIKKNSFDSSFDSLHQIGTLARGLLLKYHPAYQDVQYIENTLEALKSERNRLQVDFMNNGFDPTKELIEFSNPAHRRNYRQAMIIVSLDREIERRKESEGA